MKTSRIAIAVLSCLLLTAGAWADYFSTVAEAPPPCLKSYDQSTPQCAKNGSQHVFLSMRAYVVHFILLTCRGTLSDDHATPDPIAFEGTQ